GSVYITDPVGPTMDEILSDGSPLPPPISSTSWPIPIRASSTRPDVSGANICSISARYLSQYRAEVCHASSTFFCSSGIILVPRKLTRFTSALARRQFFRSADDSEADRTLDPATLNRRRKTPGSRDYFYRHMIRRATCFVRRTATPATSTSLLSGSRFCKAAWRSAK